MLDESYVLISEKRKERSNLFIKKISDKKSCPFDEGNELMTPAEVYAVRDNNKKDQTGWKIRVVPNLYAAVSKSVFKTGENQFFKVINGYGYAEIIVETPIHNQRMDQYSLKQFELYFAAIINRLSNIAKDRNIKYIQVFKNNGIDSGASQTHQHTQIIAIPFVPKMIANRFKRLKEYYEKNGRSYFSDLVEQEIALNERIILETSDFAAICPYASKTPFEIMIIPKDDIASLTLLDSNKLVSLSKILKKLMAALYRKFKDFSFNLTLSEPPKGYNDAGNFFRFYITILPKMTTAGGFEQATAIFINPYLPKESAKELKSILKQI